MKNYLIFVQGENFNLEVDGQVQCAGFFATRRAEAQTEEEAASIVLKQLENESALQSATHASSQPASNMRVKIIHEMPLEHKNNYTGFTAYPIDGA